MYFYSNYRIQAYIFAKLLKCEYVALIGYPLSPSVAILDQKQCVIQAVKRTAGPVRGEGRGGGGVGRSGLYCYYIERRR